MKTARLYLSKEMIAEKLGIKSNQLVLGEVTGDGGNVEFSIYVDDSTEVNGVGVIPVPHSGWNVARQRLELK